MFYEEYEEIYKIVFHASTQERNAKLIDEDNKVVDSFPYDSLFLMGNFSIEPNDDNSIIFIYSLNKINVKYEDGNLILKEQQ